MTNNIKIFAYLLLLTISFNVVANADIKRESILHTSADRSTETKAIELTLNSFHLSAAQADAQRYLGLLSDESVFLGTDASERWTKKQFRAFVLPYFTKGQGWVYIPVERNITVLPNDDFAYFDELLDNKNYGRCRGTGMLIKTASGWKISQYSLSVPLPNPIAKELVEQIQTFEESRL